MLFPLLLILGTAALSFALRSFHHPVLQKLGALAILATSFLAGWLLTGYLFAGVVCAFSWFLLPWLEILTRVRRLRLPPEKNLRQKSAPSRELFPALDEITAEVEEEGFEQAGDAGWDWDDYQQFFRLFFRKEERAQSAICLIDQSDIAFFYLSISSRAKDGTVWTTWNYPFARSMKQMPQSKINRLPGNRTFPELLESHRAFLQSNHISTDQLEEVDADNIPLGIQKDLRLQIAHNLAKGVLTRAEGDQIRYSWRGMIYIWIQFLRDLMRLS